MTKRSVRVEVGPVVMVVKGVRVDPFLLLEAAGSVALALMEAVDAPVTGNGSDFGFQPVTAEVTLAAPFVADFSEFFEDESC